MPIWIVVYLMLTTFAIALNALLALYTWRHQEATGARAFLALLLLITLWSLLAYFQVVWRDYQGIFRNLSYVCIAGAPVLLLMFVLQYGGMDRWFTPGRVAGLFVIPGITQLVIWLPQLRPLWETADARGPWFWVHSFYAYMLVFISFTLMLVKMPRVSAQKRRQLAIILFGLGVPVTVNVLLTFDLIPHQDVDWSPLAFSVSGVAIAWALYRYRLFDLAPLARDALIDRMRDGMLVLDTRYEVRDVNPMACDILGRAAGTLVGYPLPWAREIWTRLEPLLTLSPPRAGALALDFVGKDGGTYYYDVRVTPLYGRDADLIGYLILFYDITERVASERAIQQYAEVLETRNAELDAFAHTVAHDLKTPLTTVVGFGRLLQQRGARLPPERIVETAERIVISGDKMTTIIDELLLLSSVRKSGDVARVPLDMPAILGEVQERLAEMLTEYDATLTPAGDAATWPAALGHAPWVEAVWTNYVSNALKYGGRPPRIELGAAVLDSGLPILEPLAQSVASKIQNPQSKILFWVRDNGPGLSPQEQAQLFTPFTRLHQERAEGHGLGLSIVERIVAQLGGEVGVVSAEGAGATFWFTLSRDTSQG